MKLSKAFEMQVAYMDKAEPIRVDENGFVCITDLVKFFPRKRIVDWEKLVSTKSFINTVSNFLNNDDSRCLKLLVKRRGRYDGGTYAHDLIAMEFATWLSPEFKLRVYLEYQNGTQHKKDWNIKRVLAAHNYKIMSKAITADHEKPRHYHYSNEALMINEIVFGARDSGMRKAASLKQLDDIATLDGHNTTLIMLGMPYKERKIKLRELFEPIKKELKGE